MRALVVTLVLAASAYASLDVGVDTILAPSGTIDSGQITIPRCVVANYSDSTANLWAHVAIDWGGSPPYRDSLWLEGLQPGARETVAFTGWIPPARDSMDAKAWTECAGDTFPADDTARQKFLVRVKDIAATEITNPAPDTTLDSGAVLRCQARVWNYGNVSLNFDVRFCVWRIDTVPVPPDYEARRNLNLIAGGATLVTAPDSWTPKPGTWVLEVAALVPGDCHPENNVLCDTFTARGTINRDACAGYLTFDGPWPMHVGDTVIPGTWQGYNSLEPDSLWEYVELVRVGGNREYYESLHVFFPDTAYIHWFPAVVFQVPGQYEGIDSVCLPGDQNHTNDVSKIRFEVLPEVGVEESRQPTAYSLQPTATVLCGLPTDAVVFDAMGRRVLSPKPGVYFVTEKDAQNAVHVRKVAIAR